MRLRQVSFLTFLLALTHAMTAFAGYVFVVPQTGQISGAVRGYTDNLTPISGTLNAPEGVFQALSSRTGDKVVFLAANPVSPVSFATIVANAFQGPVRPVSLSGRIPVRGEISADGQKVIVIARDPNALYIVDIASETTGDGQIPLPEQPKDLALSPDGRYAYVVCDRRDGINYRYVVVDLLTRMVVYDVTQIGELNNVSVSPTGRVFVTSLYQLLEFNPGPPFTEIGYTQTFSSPGKIAFSPDGRYLLAPYTPPPVPLSNPPSIQVFDITVPGAGAPNRPGAPGLVSALVIPVPGGAGNIQFKDVVVVSENRAFGHSENTGRLYEIAYPSLAAAPAVVSGVGAMGVIAGFAATNEFPTRRSYFYAEGSFIRQVDVATGGQGTLVNTEQEVSRMLYAATPSLTAPNQLLPYGGGQIVGPGATLKPYAVRAVDAAGKPVIGATISFSSASSGIVLSVPSAVTNKDGIVTVTASAPVVNGDFTVVAQYGGLSVNIVSRVTGADTGGPGEPGPGGPRIIKVRGDGQLRPVGGFDDPGNPSRALVVRLVDAEGKPIVGAPVTWSFSQFVGALSPESTVTDELGEASFLWLPGGSPTIGNPILNYSITANSTIGSVTFSAVGFPTQETFNYPSIYLVRPGLDATLITARLGEPVQEAIEIAVLSGVGGVIGSTQPLQNVGLRVFTPFTNPAEGPVAQCEGGIVLTNASGSAVCNLIITGRVGRAPLIVDVGGGYGFFDRLEVQVLPGNPIAPVILQGNRQTIRTNETAPLALVARVRDAFGNDLAGQSVSWEIVTANTLALSDTISTTNSTGQVSTRVRSLDIPGTHQVRLRIGNVSTIFEVIVESRLGGVSIVSGNNQTGVIVGQPFPQPLVVRLTDVTGAPVANQTVTWVVAGGAATLSAGSSVSNANGQASISVTAGGTAGSITVTATAGSLPPVVFSLTSRPPGPSLTATSFRNAASNEVGIARGGLVRITGAGLAPNTTGIRNANILGGRLPLEFEGVRVEFIAGGTSHWAPIYQVARVGTTESVLIQVPFEIPEGITTVSATVYVLNGSSTISGITVLPASPGVLEDDFGGGRIAAVVIRSDGAVVTPVTPARRGETLRMYVIGLGQTTPVAETNRVGQPDQFVKAKVAVGIDNAGVEVVSAKLAENLIGIYEIVFVVPATATIGNDRPLGFVMEVQPGQPIYANGSIIAIGPQ